MQPQSNLLQYEAPEEKFKELWEIYKQKYDLCLLFEPGVLNQIYKKLQKQEIYLTSFISQGNYGLLFGAKYKNEYVAVKCVKNPNQKDIKEETDILLKLKDTPFVCPLVKDFYSKDKSKYFQVTKKYSSNLQEIMEQLFEKKKTFELNSIVGFAIQMATVLEKFQSGKMMYSDIRPNNILYDKHTKSFSLCNFGVSKILENQEESITSEIKGGNRKYSAPELADFDFESFNVKYDIYGLGLILLEMSIGKILDGNECKQIRQGNLQNYMSQNLLYSDLNLVISQMLQINPEIRIDSFKLKKLLISLKSKIEIQFISSLEVIKTKKAESQAMISKLRQSFDQINCDFQKNEIFLSDYCYCEVSRMQNCAANRFIDKLHLCLRRLDVEKCINIGESLSKQSQNLIELDLDLSWNGLNTQQIDFIANGLSKCHNLSQLNVQFFRCKLNTESIQKIGKSFEKLKNLTNLHLNLGYNSLESHEIDFIAESLEKCTNISSLSLDFSNNELDAQAAKSVGTCLEKCKNVTNLTLKFYRQTLEIDALKNIAKSLEQCQNITSLKLDLYNCKLGDQGANIITKSLENCQKIDFLNLNLSGNDISVDGAKNLLKSLNKCQNINNLELVLSNNSLSQEDMQEIRNQIKLFQTFDKIYL